MNVLVLVNDPPYGTERCYKRAAAGGRLAKREEGDVRVFLIGDAVGCATPGQALPNGYYHLDRMVGAAVRHGAQVGRRETMAANTVVVLGSGSGGETGFVPVDPTSRRWRSSVTGSGAGADNRRTARRRGTDDGCNQ
jgi:hypothetical protein